MSVLDRITVVIPVLNEQENLSSCLDSLSQFNHVVVVDSGSTDQTTRICNQRNIPIVEFSWNGVFPKKRNWVLETVVLSGDWVLFLDADESLTEAFVDELLLSFDPDVMDGYWLTYSNNFEKKEMFFGVPQRKLALFKKNFRYERYEHTGTSKYDMEIHEHPVGLVKTGEIRSKIIHNDYRGLTHFVEKHLVYAEWEVERFFNGVDYQYLTFRQRFKYRLIQFQLFSLLYFLFDYVIRFRFLDGVTGFSYAFYKAFYFKLIADLIKEKHRANKR